MSGRSITIDVSSDLFLIMTGPRPIATICNPYGAETLSIDKVHPGLVLMNIMSAFKSLSSGLRRMLPTSRHSTVLFLSPLVLSKGLLSIKNHRLSMELLSS